MHSITCIECLLTGCDGKVQSAVLPSMVRDLHTLLTLRPRTQQAWHAQGLVSRPVFQYVLPLPHQSNRIRLG